MIAKNKQEALLKNQKIYNTGKPCKYGHYSDRYITGVCLECKKMDSEKYRKNNKEKIKLWHKENHKKNYSQEKRRLNYLKNIEREILNHARHRALMKNLDFNLDKEDIVIPEFCPVFGSKINIHDKPNGPSLDRIDNNLGYIKSNVKIISNKANRLKNNGSIKDFEMIIEYMKNNTTFQD